MKNMTQKECINAKFDEGLCNFDERYEYPERVRRYIRVTNSRKRGS